MDGWIAKTLALNFSLMDGSIASDSALALVSWIGRSKRLLNRYSYFYSSILGEQGEIGDAELS